MKIENIYFLILGVLLLFVISGCVSEQPATTGSGQSAPAGECDRACLENFADRYIEAMVAHDPLSVPLSDNVRFTENGVELEVGDALWATASGNTDFGIYAADPETGQVGYSGIVEENGTRVLISFRLRILDGRISEIEQIVGRDRNFSGVDNLKEPDPVYARILEPSERRPREEMIPIADSYFAALERADGKRPVPFADTCNRMENGVQTTNNPELGAGMGGGYNIMAMSCTEQFKTGYFKFVTEIRRRHVMVDEERGMVFSFAALDHAGNIKQVTTNDGQTHDIGQLSPSTLYGGGLFKIIDGRIHRIYTVFFTAPYGMKHAW
ncbi:MAG: hypothetical protein JXR49_05375 [Acidobacteria bacterium]|nr:hypothetical protein [Acidobacteriota bacterium]